MSEKVDPSTLPATAGEVEGDSGAARVWASRTAGVLRGLTHGLGNRLHAMELVRANSDAGEPVTPELLALWRVALDECGKIAERYRVLVFGMPEELEPCRVVELLPTALALRAAHTDVRIQEAAAHVIGDPPAVLAPPRGLTQALLLLLLPDAAAEAGAPVVRVTGDADAVTVDIHREASSSPDEATLRAVRWLLRDIQPLIRLERVAAANRGAVRLTLPSLAVSRRAAVGRG